MTHLRLDAQVDIMRSRVAGSKADDEPANEHHTSTVSTINNVVEIFHHSIPLVLVAAPVRSLLGCQGIDATVDIRRRLLGERL